MNKISAAFFLLFSCGMLFGQHEKARGTTAMPEFNKVEDYRNFYKIHDLHLLLDVYQTDLSSPERSGKIEIHSC